MQVPDRLADGRWRWLVVGTVAAWILATSVIPASSGAPATDATGPLGLVGVDKWLHAGVYFLLGAAGAFALGDRRASPRAMLAVFLGVAAVGAGVELVQAPLATRHADPGDAVANAVGAAAAVAGWRLVVAVRVRSELVDRR